MKVYIKNSWRVNSGQERVYHTDAECQHLKKARQERIMEKKLDNLIDVRECKECAGRSESGQSNPNLEINQTLQDEDFGPEDLGLTPTGER